MNIICPASLCFENEGFTINGQVGRIYFVDEYPKSLESDIISALTKMNCTSFVTVANELLDISGFKQEIARKYMRSRNMSAVIIVQNLIQLKLFCLY